MVYRSQHRKSKKRSRSMNRKTHKRRSKRQTSRKRRSHMSVSKTKSRKRSRRRKSRKKSRRRRSRVRVRRPSNHLSRRRRSNRRSRRQTEKQNASVLLTNETRLRFNFSSSSSPTTSSPTRRDKLAVPLVIFGMNGCPGCDNAKNICKKKGIKFSYHLRKDNEETVRKVAPGYRYVPVIVNRFGKFIGGSDKLQEYTKNMPDVN